MQIARRSAATPHGPAAPRAPRLPVIGNLLPYVRDPLGFLRAMREKHGDVVDVALGPLEVTLLRHPELVEDVLVTRSKLWLKDRFPRTNLRLAPDVVSHQGAFVPPCTRFLPAGGRCTGSGMLKLHGFPMSPNTRRARLMLEELGLPYQLVPVDLMSGAHRGDAYRELNPTSRVPTLVDGDFKLWESNAILVYLAELSPERKLAGDGARERAEVSRWMFMNASHMSPAVARIFAHTIRLPEDKRIPQVVEESRRELDRCLGPLDAQLSDKEFVAGRFTIADVALAPTLSAAPMLGIDLGKTPAVTAWMQRIGERDAWKKSGV